MPDRTLLQAARHYVLARQRYEHCMAAFDRCPADDPRTKRALGIIADDAGDRCEEAWRHLEEVEVVLAATDGIERNLHPSRYEDPEVEQIADAIHRRDNGGL